MKWLILVLLLMLAGLQYRFWVGDTSYAQVMRLEHAIAQQEQENSRLQHRNQVLAVEVNDLKTGTDGIEERARHDLGMIKQGETFYMVVKDGYLNGHRNDRPANNSSHSNQTFNGNTRKDSSNTTSPQ